MKKVLIVKNVPHEGPGQLEQILNDRHIPFDLIDLENGDALPSPTEYQAFIVLGGPDSANDENEKMFHELHCCREAIEADMPYLGICLGLQTLVQAGGGRVIKSPVKEVGFRDPDGNNFTVELTEKGRKDPLFKGLGDSFKVFHLHGETVELDSNMHLLATGKFCQNQIVRVGEKAYGIQSHFELTPDMFQTWLDLDPDLKAMNREQLEQDFIDIREDYMKTGHQLLSNFLDIAGL